MKFFLKVVREAVAFSMRVYVLPKLWLWFAVPLGAPELGWAHIFGLGLLGHVLAGARPDYMDAASETDKEIREWAHSLATPPLLLLFGYIYKSCM